jgi:hypothetical protein
MQLIISAVTPLDLSRQVKYSCVISLSAAAISGTLKKNAKPIAVTVLAHGRLFATSLLCKPRTMPANQGLWPGDLLGLRTDGKQRLVVPTIGFSVLYVLVIVQLANLWICSGDAPGLGLSNEALLECWKQAKS